jgi:signal transduction histidine kinase
VLFNLISNAVKFTARERAPRIDVTAINQPNGWIRICVRDNGIGIAPEHQQRIFKVFERLHGAESYPGTGIGLAIVKRAMERMNGRYGLESKVGVGSTFWVELPGAKLSARELE